MSDGAAVPPALPVVAVAEPKVSRLSLAARTGLLTAAVAALTVVVAGLIAYPIVRQASIVQAQATLEQQADVIAGLLAGRQTSDVPEGELRDRVQALEAQGIAGYIVGRGAEAPPPATTEDINTIVSGGTVSSARETGDGLTFVEGRPLPRRQGLLLIQKAVVANAPTLALLKRLLLALVVGMVLSVLVGVLASRRVTRSLREAAVAAERLSTGERDVRLKPEGPAEIADIAGSLNRLAAALAVSENRQRSFLMSVSHELRTPLTAVKGYAEALSDGIVPPDDVERTGAVVKGEADRLERLVSDLLDLARAGSVDLRLDVCDVDLYQFAADAGQVWNDRCARDGVEFRLEPPPVDATIATDPVRLRQIVDNRAENALRVTPSGQLIVLAVRADPTTVAVEVRDGGPGLSDDDLAVAFVPEELHSRYRGVRKVGTGLGLALVGSLATRLGGTAEAGHAAEGGARFTVTIPRSTPTVRTLDQ